MLGQVLSFPTPESCVKVPPVDSYSFPPRRSQARLLNRRRFISSFSFFFFELMTRSRNPFLTTTGPF